MGRVGRLAGAILAESGGRWFLVGNPKGPLDLGGAGFEAAGVVVDAMRQPWIELRPTHAIALAAPVLRIDLEGEALARCLAERFLIERNGSVSDRLWRLVLQGERGPARGPSDDDDDDDDDDGDEEPTLRGEPGVIDARWLGLIPAPVWRLVRDTVLRCS